MIFEGKYHWFLHVDSRVHVYIFIGY